MRDVDVTGLTADSRAVGQGFLFAALPGAQDDGRAYIDDAIARGARVVLAPEGTHLDQHQSVQLVTHDNPRRLLAELAARFYGRQPRTMVAVTGTNGKSSVVGFVRQIWQQLGLMAGSMGTLGLEAPGFAGGESLTTPDQVRLHHDLAALAKAGVDHMAIEASSHGLDQYRLDGVRFQAAAFTNLGRDHLDYHGDIAHYLAAKMRLFDTLMAVDGTAVLNADIPEYAAMRAICKDAGVDTRSYGRRTSDIRLDDLAPLPDGQRICLTVNGRSFETRLPLVGEFQAYNALAALGLVIACGGDLDGAVAALCRLQGVKGRLELVARHPNKAPIYVDFAHTADALETVLSAIRPHVSGKLVVVFGAGGDRDPGKRPLMGAACARLADRCIVTDDNPRSEDPAVIRQAVLAACPGAKEIGARDEAIRHAIAGLGPDDLLVIAGKGH
ncbi:MAG: UDP-N-acetylmuramoyl-L-alanyl-D-glutamate--2,6-diaminopimelate ligase, partial [Alphaproteobacteria bacterium]